MLLGLLPVELLGERRVFGLRVLSCGRRRSRRGRVKVVAHSRGSRGGRSHGRAPVALRVRLLGNLLLLLLLARQRVAVLEVLVVWVALVLVHRLVESSVVAVLLLLLGHCRGVELLVVGRMVRVVGRLVRQRVVRALLQRLLHQRPGGVEVLLRVARSERLLLLLLGCRVVVGLLRLALVSVLVLSVLSHLLLLLQL